MKSFLPNDIKDQNRKIIFDIFLQEPDLAKVEVANRTTMSKVTVNKIVDYFAEAGIVSANGEVREGSGGMGRKRSVYSFNPNSYLTIGIQLIGNKIFAALVNLHSEMIDTFETDAEVKFYEESFADILQLIYEKFKQSIQNTSSRIIGIGIGVDGAINTKQKTIRMRMPDNQKEEDFFYEEIMDRLSGRLRLPILLENDTNASAIAEFSYFDRGGNGPNDLLLIALGEGLGAGLILDKKLHRGFYSGVGELEYMCFDPEYVFQPSSVGWLESKMSLDYLKREYGFDPDCLEHVAARDRGRCVDYISRYLAMTIINIVSLLDIHCVVLTGKTILAVPDEVIVATKKYVRQFTGRNLDIRCGTTNHATAVGAAILSLQSEMTKVITG